MEFINVFMWISYAVALYFAVFWVYSYIEKSHYFHSEKSKTKLDDYPFVSVIIPAYNEEDSIEETANSVLGLDYPKDKLQLIIVNDGSRDRTLEIMHKIKKKNPARTILILSHKNMGKAASMNRAINYAPGKYFACLDADSVVSRQTLKKMMAMHIDDPSLAAATPAMKVREPKTLVQKMQWLEYITAIFYARIMGHMDMIYITPGPFSLYRKDVVKKLGGFEVGNLTEDMEMGYRMQKHHYKIRQCFDAYVHSIAPKNLKELYKQRNRWYKGGILNFFRYKTMFFNPSYGDFGMFMMPSNISMFIWAMFGFFFFIYLTYKPVSSFLHNLWIIRFNIMPHVMTFFDSPINIFDFTVSRGSLFFVVMGFSLLLLYISYRNANERIRKNGLWHIIPYLFLYFPMLGAIIFIVLIQIVFGKKQKW